jgi:Flp pilus assembly protein TadD
MPADENTLDAARKALRERRLPEALRLATRAAADAPDSLETRLVLARVLLEERRDAEAEEELRRAQEIDPASALPLVERGRFAARRGALRDAVEAWRHYLAKHPGAANGEGDRVREAADLAARLDMVLEELADV